MTYCFGTHLPEPGEYVSRYFHSSVVLGDWVYIDGGETRYNLEGATHSNPQEEVLNYTLALDMSTSWTNTSVSFRTIPRAGAPLLNQPALWPSKSEDAFYRFGGQMAFCLPTAAPQYQYTGDPWKFTPDNRGGGQWDQVSLPTWSTSIVPGNGLAASGNGLGFYLGGFLSAYTRPSTDVRDPIPLSAMVMFNSTSATWQNITSYVSNTGNSSQAGQAAYGGSHFVPVFGPEGIAVFFGVAPPLASPDMNVTTPGSMSQVSIFEPRSQTWYNQTATGPSIPSWRGDFCTTGVAGDNGTYEIIMHGGTRFVEGVWLNSHDAAGIKSLAANELALDQIYILSLPSFTWYQAPYAPFASRSSHTCHTVGPGNGQLLTIGGGNFANGVVPGKRGDSDVLTQGLGVFDLNQLQWVPSYDSTGVAYKTPQSIKDHIAVSGSTPSAWDDPSLAQVFAISRASDGAQQTSPTGTVVVDNTVAQHTSSIGMIVGAVVGSTVALFFAVGLAVFLLRRNRARRREGRPWGELEGMVKVELPAENTVHEMGADERHLRELPGHVTGNRKGTA